MRNCGLWHLPKSMCFPNLSTGLAQIDPSNTQCPSLYTSTLCTDAKAMRIQTSAFESHNSSASRAPVPYRLRNNPRSNNRPRASTRVCRDTRVIGGSGVDLIPTDRWPMLFTFHDSRRRYGWKRFGGQIRTKLISGYRLSLNFAPDGRTFVSISGGDQSPMTRR
jgi:hypothetical protein